jgi:membrane-associated phospholipid phosphatase
MEQSSSTLPEPAAWVKATGVAAGAVLLAGLTDKPVDRAVSKHQDSRILRHWDKVGKALPYALVGAAGAAFALGDERMQNTGLIALQSLALTSGVAYGSKYLIARARPGDGKSAWGSFGNAEKRSDGSFPSGHASIAFAAVTPFAKEYDAPWLYGVAALGSAGRVAGRKHWVSDTVAGGILGYAVGSWLWQSQRDQSGSRLSISPGPKELSISWQKEY